MRVFALFALALPLLASATRSIQPSAKDIAAARSEKRALASEAHAARMTNARRMKMGLPPLRPRNIAPARRGTPTINVVNTRPSASPSASPVPSGAAPPPPSFKGVVKVARKTDGTFLGFVGKDAPTFGEFTPAPAFEDAAVVEIAGLKPGLNGPVDVVSADKGAPFPFWGAITGFAATDDSLASGSFNYKYIGGVLQSPPHSTPVLQFNAFTSATGIAARTESAIWSVNTVTGELSAQWVNPDGRTAPSTLALYVPDNVLVLVGDLAAFAAEFGETVPITLTLFSTDSTP